MKKTILVIAAHPDDELLGAGGALIKHRLAGDSVHALILGAGVLSRVQGSAADRDTLRNESSAAHKVVGFSTATFGDFPDNEYDTISLLKITKYVEDGIRTVKPHVVYTHHEHDLNIDHRITFQAVLTASRPCNTDAPESLYTFETLSSTEWQSKGAHQFCPSTYVDVSEVLLEKQKALACYKSEMRQHPHSRSLEGVKILAQFRGLESGLALAEAFHLVREIKK